MVTICPPKGSNTALYHDLVKAGNKSLSDKDKGVLRESAYKSFIENPNKEYVKMTLAVTNPTNLDQVYEGFQSLPKHAGDKNGFEIKMWNVNGTITSPWYGGDYVEEFYREDRDICILLEIPDDIKGHVGSGAIIIDVEVDTREIEGWQEEVSFFTTHSTEKNWTEAEAECQREGGHLASITSEEK